MLVQNGYHEWQGLVEYWNKNDRCRFCGMPFKNGHKENECPMMLVVMDLEELLNAGQKESPISEGQKAKNTRPGCEDEKTCEGCTHLIGRHCQLGCNHCTRLAMDMFSPEKEREG